MGEIETRTAEQAGLNDDELPVMPDPSLAFWKANAKGLLGESIKAIEEAAKQIIGVTGILEGLYFHAIAYSSVRGKVDGWSVLIYVAPLCCWLVSLTLALLVFFPRTYATNFNSARESRSAFERLVAYKHNMLKNAGFWMALGALALAAALGRYLAG